jgi:hypothetical protein
MITRKVVTLITVSKETHGVIINHILFKASFRGCFLFEKELIAMYVGMRKTAQGIEYWDTEGKKIHLVLEGQSLGVEVTKNPKSMLVVDDKKVAGAVEKKIDGTKEELLKYLVRLNVEQLLAYAKDNDIDVPGNMKKEETIRNHIVEKLNPGDE